MTALERNPQTLNLLPALDFVLVVKRCPNVNFFAQKTNLPGISGEAVPINTPLATIIKNFDHITFHPLQVTFKLDETLSNYLEIHNWMRALGPTKNYKGYQQLQKNSEASGLGLYSELSLIFLDSNKNPKIEAIFMDAFPTDLSDIYFDTTQRGVAYHTATVTFAYTLYDIAVI